MQQSGSNAGPGHRVEPGAVGLADDHRELRHGRLGDGADHLRPVADDALALDVGADHEPGHVGEEEQRDVEGVAGHDEAGRLVGGVDEQHAALVPGLVGDDRRSRARRGARSRRRAPSPSARGPRRRSRRRPAPSISSLDVEGRLLVVGDDLRDRAPGAAGRRRRRRRRLAPVRRHVGEVAAGEVDRLLVACDQEVAAAGDAGVHPGAAHLLERHLLADHHLRHPRRAEVHRGVAVAHDHDVAEGRDVGAAGGARARTAGRPAAPAPTAGPRCGRSARRRGARGTSGPGR